MADWDYVIVGSGFGGSVSALRLVEKGYRVLVLEKGGRLGADDFPKTNWNLKRWLWRPELGFRGLFKMTFLPHLTAVTGVGVGGGSLVYANTLPVPKESFFSAPSWGSLAAWKEELAPHYQTAKRMLGATRNPRLTVVDDVVKEIGEEMGRGDSFHPTDVAVYFGEPGVTVADPYFDGEGPARTGCNSCGGCMLGCRFGAKNTLDKNYLYLAEKRGLVIEPDTEVTWVRPSPEGGYDVTARHGTSPLPSLREERRHRAKNVIFSGGVLGTTELLLRLKQSDEGLPRLSERLGDYVRTNSEVLMGIVSERRDKDLSKGIAIGSILHTDESSHLEPVRYPAGAGFFRLLALPHAPGDSLAERLAHAAGMVLRHPLKTLKAWLVPDWARNTMVLLYMRALEGHIRLRLGRTLTTGFVEGLTTAAGDGPPAKASIPEATALAERIAKKIDGYPQSMMTETLFGIPTTAHILGGACMGGGPAEGVIDHRHRVFGYEGLYVIDGAAVSANPGVNPSLTITALAERAMGFIPPKEAEERADDERAQASLARLEA
jgi:cholesterol oxidase